MKAALLTLIFTFLAMQLGFAHEGHDLPGSIQAQHGGVVKATKDLYIELVQDGNNLKIYPMTHDFKPVSLNEVQMTGTAMLPRIKTKSLVKLTEKKNDDKVKSHFMGSFDAKGAHRYTFILEAKYQGKNETVVFQVEPKY